MKISKGNLGGGRTAASLSFLASLKACSSRVCKCVLLPELSVCLLFEYRQDCRNVSSLDNCNCGSTW